MLVDGSDILDILTRKFPEYTIVFRPYPGEKSLDACKPIADKFLDRKNFIYDTSPTGLSFQKRALFLVSDCSSSAITFSIATLRPIILASFDCESSDVKEFALGFSVDSKQAFMDALDSVFNNISKWRDTISNNVKEILYNPHTAATYIANHLHLIAARETCVDWLSINREPWIVDDKNKEKSIQEHIKRIESIMMKPVTNPIHWNHLDLYKKEYDLLVNEIKNA